MTSTDTSPPSFKSAAEEIAHWRSKCQEYGRSLQEMREELQEFQTSSRELEAELETQLEQQERGCAELRGQLNRLALENQLYKERLQKEQNEFSAQLTKLQEELAEIKTSKEQLISYVRELEQANDDLERGKRTMLSSLEDFESRLNQTIERNAFLESELDEKESLKVMVQRLKDEARDLKQEVKIQKRTTQLPDNDKAAKQQKPLLIRQHLNQQLNLERQNATTIIDSNKLISEDEKNPNTKCNNLHNLNNGNVPMTPSARISALNIVGDLLRKVGALESRLASCRTLVKENQRPLSLPPAGNHSAR